MPRRVRHEVHLILSFLSEKCTPISTAKAGRLGRYMFSHVVVAAAAAGAVVIKFSCDDWAR